VWSSAGSHPDVVHAWVGTTCAAWRRASQAPLAQPSRATCIWRRACETAAGSSISVPRVTHASKRASPSVTRARAMASERSITVWMMPVTCWRRTRSRPPPAARVARRRRRGTRALGQRGVGAGAPEAIDGGFEQRQGFSEVPERRFESRGVARDDRLEIREPAPHRVVERTAQLTEGTRRVGLRVDPSVAVERIRNTERVAARASGSYRLVGDGIGHSADGREPDEKPAQADDARQPRLCREVGTDLDQAIRPTVVAMCVGPAERPRCATSARPTARSTHDCSS
jgi:hypothetical protein